MALNWDPLTDETLRTIKRINANRYITLKPGDCRVMDEEPERKLLMEATELRREEAYDQAWSSPWHLMDETGGVVYRGWRIWKWTGWKGNKGSWYSAKRCDVCNQMIAPGEPVWLSQATDITKHWDCHGEPDNIAGQWAAVKPATGNYGQEYLMVSTTGSGGLTEGFYDRGARWNLAPWSLTGESDDSLKEQARAEALNRMLDLIEQIEDKGTEGIPHYKC